MLCKKNSDEYITVNKLSDLTPHLSQYCTRKIRLQSYCMLRIRIVHNLDMLLFLANPVSMCKRCITLQAARTSVGFNYGVYNFSPNSSLWPLLNMAQTHNGYKIL